MNDKTIELIIYDLDKSEVTTSHARQCLIFIEEIKPETYNKVLLTKVPLVKFDVGMSAFTVECDGKHPLHATRYIVFIGVGIPNRAQLDFFRQIVALWTIHDSSLLAPTPIIKEGFGVAYKTRKIYSVEF